MFDYNSNQLHTQSCHRHRRPMHYDRNKLLKAVTPCLFHYYWCTSCNVPRKYYFMLKCLKINCTSAYIYLYILLSYIFGMYNLQRTKNHTFLVFDAPQHATYTRHVCIIHGESANEYIQQNIYRS